MTTFTIYCDKADDEELAEHVFRGGPLAAATIKRLPRRQNAPQSLQAFLSWERADWLITRDDRLVAAVEISRHGYTGDNGFQRFARLERASALGIPCIYFTPFSRTRNNELIEGPSSARNVAPEMFLALLNASEERGVPSIALRWPTDAEGTPYPLGVAETSRVESQLSDILSQWATRHNIDDRDAMWAATPQDVTEDMATQAAIAYRGSETRGLVTTPLDPRSLNWFWDFLPPKYFEYGKADKILAYAALLAAEMRAFEPGAPQHHPWRHEGQARVLYLGYQWRPDPTCGLIAYSGVLARAEGVPLIVVWPRVFLSDGPERQGLLSALQEFADHATGPIASYGHQLGRTADTLAAFAARISTNSTQFGLFSERSKVARILAENADLVVFGDGLYLP